MDTILTIERRLRVEDVTMAVGGTMFMDKERDLDCFRLAVEETRRSNSGNFLHNKNLQARVAKQSNAVSFGPDPLDASCRRQLSSSVEREDLTIELDQSPSQTFSGLGLAGSPSIFNVSWHIPEDPLDRRNPHCQRLELDHSTLEVDSTSLPLEEKSLVASMSF
ncbi:hypothetical protein PGT21_015707 [Puccinia graminis f. sp. tritici]|uniref:Uncharacterized protein n=1 Tax=Puccinia graminis f. sp. tritici TaxID=56615 RepID=A0A5B0R1E3_PUCGR|nr:hypothetical protein PGT21_015707 [Puccinia graminis f. sp. tritici]